MADLHYTKAPATSDEFNDSTLAPKWTESYQAGGSGSESGGTLSLISGDEMINMSTFDASGVYQSGITGDFDFKIAIPSYTEYSSYWGMACYIDATHYISAWNYSGYIYRNGASSGNSGTATEPQTTIYQRLKRVGSNISVYFSTNGSDWDLEYTSTGIGSGSCQIWLYCNDNGSPGVTADFDWIRSEPNYVINDITLYNAEGGTWHDSLRVRVAGATWYAQLDSNTSHIYASDLRIRQNGTTYAVLTEEGTPS